MSEGYTKLFSDLVDSSIWDEDPKTCKVWVTLLALANWEGYIRGSVSWLARKARVDLQSCREALDKFAAPDPHSRTPDNEGRRIEVLPDGWLLLNYLIFRDRLSTNPVSVATRERVRRHRERYNALRNAESVTAAHSVSVSVSDKKRGNGGKEKSYSPDSRVLLHYLNEKTGKRFREVAANLDPISARLKEAGVDLTGCKQMLDRQVARWKGTAQEEYLRPTTLFGKQKFDGYYAARDQPVIYENKTNGSQRVDRNKGTYNEGIASIYKDAAIKAGKVPDVQRPVP